jgi:hypothetical protein
MRCSQHRAQSFQSFHGQGLLHPVNESIPDCNRR